MGILSYVVLLLSIVTSSSLNAHTHTRKQEDSQWKVEVLITSPSFQSLETAFGHSSLLLIPPGQPVEHGSVWSFLANTASIDSRDWKSLASGALLGRFPIVVEREPALSFFSRHLIYESRDIQRLIIPATRRQGERLQQLMQELEADPSSLGSYFFRSENCMTALLRALKQSGFDINLNQLKSTTSGYGMIPKQLPVFLENLLISYYPKELSLSLLTQIKNLEKQHRLNLESKQVNGLYIDWSLREKGILTELDFHELVLVSYSLAIADEARLAHIRNLLANRPRPETGAMFQLKDFPDSFYRSCNQRHCAENLIRDFSQFYTKRDFQRIYSTLNIGLERSRSLFMPELKLLDSAQARHWRLLRDVIRGNRP